MNHRIGRVLFAIVVGISVAFFSYRWITDPTPRANRAIEENVVTVSRQLLGAKVGIEGLQIVDPLSPNRKIGKVYIYREGSRWAVSGYYRRDEADHWHPYLMDISDELELVGLKVNDDLLNERAKADPTVTVL